MISLLLALAIGTSHAGWFRNFCARNLVMEDPYQHEQIPTEQLIRLYREEGGRAHWRHEASPILRSLGAELRHRLLGFPLPLPEDLRDPVTQALEDYQALEQR